MQRHAHYLTDSPVELEDLLRYSEGEGEHALGHEFSPDATEGDGDDDNLGFRGGWNYLHNQSAFVEPTPHALCSRHETCARLAILAQQAEWLNRPRPRLFILYHNFKTDIPAARA